jgi:glycosyltransferase involved in cell wall biosynthesis
MSSPLISVIVPVYNAEITLRQCVDSILCQGYRDFELLLIDDGSKDSSPAICDEYASKDNRVKAFHKENAGVSAARNKGLENASGEWITFIDSDDYISEDYFRGVEGCKQQLLITGFRDEVGGNVSDNVKMVSAIYQSPEDVSLFIRTQVSSNMVLRGPWGKFYRREIIGNQVFNTQMKLGEDTCFVFDYLAKCSFLEVNASSYYVIRRGTVPDAIKYNSSVDYAVRSLHYIWESFRNMEKVHQLGHGCFYTFIGYYKLVCKHEWKNNLESWYRNPKVHAMYKYVSHEIPLSILIKYYLIRLFLCFY